MKTDSHQEAEERGSRPKGMLRRYATASPGLLLAASRRVSRCCLLLKGSRLRHTRRSRATCTPCCFPLVGPATEGKVSGSGRGRGREFWLSPAPSGAARVVVVVLRVPPRASPCDRPLVYLPPASSSGTPSSPAVSVAAPLESSGALFACRARSGCGRTGAATGHTPCAWSQQMDLTACMARKPATCRGCASSSWPRAP